MASLTRSSFTSLVSSVLPSSSAAPHLQAKLARSKQLEDCIYIFLCGLGFSLQGLHYLFALRSFRSLASTSFTFDPTPYLVDRGCARVNCRKDGIHPKFYNKAEVYCNGELVMTTGGTMPKYVVDVWSGNHPFYQGKETAFLQDADRVDRFNRRFGGDSSLSAVPILTKGEIIIEKKKKPVKGKGSKK